MVTSGSPEKIEGANLEAIEPYRSKIMFETSSGVPVTAMLSRISSEMRFGISCQNPFLAKKGFWQDIPNLISDEILESIAVTGTPDEVSNIIFDRYGSIASRLAPSIFSGDPEVTKALITSLKEKL